MHDIEKEHLTVNVERSFHTFCISAQYTPPISAAKTNIKIDLKISLYMFYAFIEILGFWFIFTAI